MEKEEKSFCKFNIEIDDLEPLTIEGHHAEVTEDGALLIYGDPDMILRTIQKWKACNVMEEEDKE